MRRNCYRTRSLDKFYLTHKTASGKSLAASPAFSANSLCYWPRIPYVLSPSPRLRRPVSARNLLQNFSGTFESSETWSFNRPQCERGFPLRPKRRSRSDRKVGRPRSLISRPWIGSEKALRVRISNITRNDRVPRDSLGRGDRFFISMKNNLINSLIWLI